MCEECSKKNNDWKFCPHCGAEFKPESKQPMTEEKFDEIFLDLLKSYSEMAWIDDNGSESDIPTSRYVLKNAEGEWLFDIDLDPKCGHFYFSYTSEWSRLFYTYGLEFKEVKELMKNLISKRFKLIDPTPYRFRYGVLMQDCQN